MAGWGPWVWFFREQSSIPSWRSANSGASRPPGSTPLRKAYSHGKVGAIRQQLALRTAGFDDTGSALQPRQAAAAEGRQCPAMTTFLGATRTMDSPP